MTFLCSANIVPYDKQNIDVEMLLPNYQLLQSNEKRDNKINDKNDTKFKLYFASGVEPINPSRNLFYV